MKYFAGVGDHTFEIEINEDGVLVDGEPIAVDLRQGGVSQLYSLLLDGASFEVLIEENAAKLRRDAAGRTVSRPGGG